VSDVQEIYAILLSKGHQDRLFSDIPGERRRQGKETLATCPFCGKERHFSYSSQEPVWRCLVCGKGGDWISYLQERQGLDFKEALVLLAQEAGVEISPTDQARHQAYTRKADLLEAAQDLFIQDLQAPQGRQVREYLLARGYTPEEIQGMELGAYTSRQRLRDHLQEAGFSDQEVRESGLLSAGLGETHTLALLWRDQAGRAIGLVGRPPLQEEERKAKGLDKYHYSAGLQKDQGFTGFSTARGAESVVLVEGILDSLYLNHKGLRPPSASLGGTTLSVDQLRALESTGTRELLLALDTDQAGQEATEKIIKSLTVSRLRPYVVALPEGFKDPDELVRAKGLPAFQEALRTAERGSSWLARRIVQKHDISTDTGLDEALDEALEVYAAILDGIDSRAFKDGLIKATGLSEADLEWRIKQARDQARARQGQAILQRTARTLQEKAAEADLLAGEEELVQSLLQIRQARGVAAPEPYLLEDFRQEILQTSEGLATGYQSLDSLFKIPTGALTIVAGRPGHGKTTFLLNLLVNMLRLYRHRRFYYFSYEEARSRLALKLTMIMAGEMINQQFNQEAYLSYLKSRRGDNEAIEQALERFGIYARSAQLFLVDAMPPAEDLAAMISQAMGRLDPVLRGAVLVDYIQKIPLQRPTEQRYLEIKRVSSLLLEQAVALDVPIIMGAQLGRSQGQATKVRLDNLRESGDIEQDASLVLGLHNASVERQQEEGLEVGGRTVELEVSVLKNRGGQAGTSRRLLFDRPVLRIKDSEPLLQSSKSKRLE
jgi:DNA primase catalytic core